MEPDPPAIFERDGDGDVFVGTWWSSGPWDPEATHGGAPAALLARAVERHAPELPDFVARLTIDLLRPVPVGRRIDVTTRTLRAGRKVAVVEAVCSVDGTDVATARALRIRRDDVPVPDAVVDADHLETAPDAASPLLLFGPGSDEVTGEDTMPGFGQANEIRTVSGGFEEFGPATVWFRLRVPVVEGEPVTPLMRVAAAADFGNGISRVLDWERHLFINPDLTVALHRYPEGEWVALESVTRIEDQGVGQSESALYDERGRIGRAIQSLLVDLF